MRTTTKAKLPFPGVLPKLCSPVPAVPPVRSLSPPRSVPQSRPLPLPTPGWAPSAASPQQPPFLELPELKVSKDCHVHTDAVEMA